MKYNVGDRVRIKSIDWYNENKNSVDNCDVVFADGWLFSKHMSNFCGKELIIEKISHATNPPHYIMKDTMFAWTDEMIEGLVEEEIIDIDDFQDDNEIIDVIDEYVHRLKNNECQINLPEGYQFTDENGNVINATKIVLEKKKEYPKTYKECCEVLDFCGDYFLTTYDADCMVKKEVYGILQQVNSLTRLLICKSAYWKIAGEEMGLGKPWEPDGNPVYAITRNDGCIVEIETGGNDEVFEFPTPEMRDTFYENFKEEIEICKELL